MTSAEGTTEVAGSTVATIAMATGVSRTTTGGGETLHQVLLRGTIRTEADMETGVAVSFFFYSNNMDLLKFFFSLLKYFLDQLLKTE